MNVKNMETTNKYGEGDDWVSMSAIGVRLEWGYR